VIFKIDVYKEAIQILCKKWDIIEFSLFGSVLSDDFRADSDVDVLVAFKADAHWDLFDLVNLREELKAMFSCDIDLLEVGTIRNPFRYKSIMSTRKIFYAA